MNKIEHVVLLMLENRSFDSMLGWLYEKGSPAKNVPKLGPGERAYEGLQGLKLQDYENVDATGTIKVTPIRGAKGLNVPNIAPGETFDEVTTQLFDLNWIEMTPGGILLAGKWRTQAELNKMPAEDIRNTLIVELSKHTNQPVEYFQGFNNDDLVGKGAVVAFLRKAGIRDDAALKNMTDGDQRKTMVVENHNHTGTPTPQLEGMSNQDLVKMGLEWLAKLEGTINKDLVKMRLEWFAKPTMKGYVRDYTNLLRHKEYSEDQVKRYAEQVMQSYTPDQLPVLNGLAEHYAVCDMWFSSVPSQTNPNRAFAFCGTSMGLADNGFLEVDPRRVAIEKLVGYKIGDDRFKAKTIFNALEEGGQTTWKVYRQSGYLPKNIAIAVDALKVAGAIPPLWLAPWLALKAAIGDISLDYLKELSSSELVSDYTHRLFPEILKIKDADSHFTKLANLDDFHSAARAGKLPNFTYIEPEWTIGETGTGGRLKSVLFHQGDDYHPPDNLDAGENLVKQIYNSLISNRAAWEKTLLIITFDEPIGSFDHIQPPVAIPPWGEGKEPGFERQYNFNFDRYGGRVPAILVSPLVEKSTVFRSTTSVPFDHTSIIATILKWRGLENRIPDFGERTKLAPTFENIVSLSTPRTDEKDVRFLKISHKAGEPVRYYDRFYLKDAMGKYISGFREHAVFPGSLFSEDPTFSEYFPIQGFVSPPGVAINSVLASAFYLQNANNRPDSGEISTRGGTEVRLIATDYGLGSYNVLGAWKDSRDCYYFNDYMEGDNSKKETWIISTSGGKLSLGTTGSLRFGDMVFIQNKYWKDQRLAPDSWFKDYLTTKDEDAYWTVVPILDEIPGTDSITLGNEYYLKHVNTGKYVTKVYKSDQWYPTLDWGNAVKLTITLPMNMSFRNGATLTSVDGMSLALVSAKEDLDSSGKRCDLLTASTNPYLYYYYRDYSLEYQTWIISLVTGSGLVKIGNKVRLINKGYGAFMAPKWYGNTRYLTTVTEYSNDCDWVLEKA